MADDEEEGNSFGREDSSIEPEMPAKSGSEIEAVVCLSAFGEDGIHRPIFVNQFEEDVLALTYEDAVRLQEFLSVAIPFVKEYRERITQ